MDDALRMKVNSLLAIIIAGALLLTGCGGKSTAKSLKDSFNEGFAASGQKIEDSPLYSKPDSGDTKKADNKSSDNFRPDGQKSKPNSKKNTAVQHYNKVEQSNYIGNSKTGVFHYAGCGSASRISAKNTVYLSHGEAVARGYRPCGRCNP